MYSVEEIKSRCISEIKTRGLSVQPFLLSVKLAKSTLDSNNKSMPKADTLAKIADGLGLSVDYLLGRPLASNDLTIDEKALLNAYRACNLKDRVSLFDLALLYQSRADEEIGKRQEFA